MLLVSPSNFSRALGIPILFAFASTPAAAATSQPATGHSPASRSRLRALQDSASAAACCDAPAGIFDCCDPEWIGDLTTDGSQLAVYQVDVQEDLRGCRSSTQGRIRLSCPAGLILISPAIEGGAPHQDCELVSEDQAECSLLRDNPVLVGCYGTTEADVLLEASVDSFLQGFCNDTQSILSVWPLIATYGGSSSYEISLAARCDASATDAAYEPLTAFDCQGDSTGGGPTSACGMEASCSQTYACTLTYIYGIGTIPVCAGGDWCNETYAPVTMTAATTPCPNQEFTQSVPNGGACNVNGNCVSGICVMEECAATTVAANQTCHEDADCATGACGKETFDPLDDQVCCFTGERVHYEPHGLEYCTGQATNASCGTNTMCLSEICSFGHCIDTHIPDREPCEEGYDCASGVCAIYFPDDNWGCCPEGGFIEREQDYDITRIFCTDLPADSSCRRDTDCDTNICVAGICQAQRRADTEACDTHNHCQNRICGLEEASEGAPTVCCPNGDASVYDVSFSYSDLWICSGLEQGRVCSSDYQCSSKSCFEGICGSDRRADLELCDTDGDCVSGRCGLAESAENAPTICCPDGDAKIYDIDWSYTDFSVCLHLGLGSACEEDLQCSSGVCFQKLCAEGRRADLESCDSSNDCISGMCGLAEASESAPSICCQNGDAKLVDVDWSYSDFWICSHVPMGGSCGSSDSQCSSGVCFQGVCQEGRRLDLELCDSNNDCISGLCGLAEAAESAPSICCPDGDAKVYDVDWTYTDYTICHHLDVGSVCLEDAMCSSGVCFQKVCTEDRKADLEPCDSNNDCISGRCGLAESSEGAPTICCQNGDALYVDVDWTYSDFWICSHVPTGGSCESSDSLCESGACFQSSCLGGRQPDLSPCDSDSDCQSLACAKNEVLEAAPTVCCPGGQVELLDVDWQRSDESFCSDQTVISSRQAGESCTAPSDCANSIACAYDSFSEEAGLICCSEFYILDVEWDYRDKIFCGDRPQGTLCGDDRQCASALCINSSCLESRLQDGEGCTKSNDCENRACAKSSFSEFSDTICCASGEAWLLDVDWSYQNEWFCGNAETNTLCGDGRMCASGLCINSKCNEKRLESGEACASGNDCLNRTCAADAYTEFSSQICCGQGESYYLDVEWTYTDILFCGELPLNATCGDAMMCSSGLCVNSICAESRLEDGEPCTTGNECKSRACAKNEFSEFADDVCCSRGESYLLDVPWTYKSIHFCGELPLNTTCGTEDRICASGLCVAEGCSETRLEDGESCTRSNQCESRACALDSFSEFADTICCENGEAYSLKVPWTYKSFWFCGQASLNTTCGDEDRLCESSKCVGGQCVAKRLEDGEECFKHSDCETAACAFDAFDEFAGKRCCNEGEMYQLDVPWNYRDYWFCGNLLSGEVCSTHHQCESKVCIRSDGEEETTGICS